MSEMSEMSKSEMSSADDLAIRLRTLRDMEFKRAKTALFDDFVFETEFDDVFQYEMERSDSTDFSNSVAQCTAAAQKKEDAQWCSLYMPRLEQPDRFECPRQKMLQSFYRRMAITLIKQTRCAI